MIGKTNCNMFPLVNAPFGAVFELFGSKLVRVDGELVEAEEEPPGMLIRQYLLFVCRINFGWPSEKVKNEVITGGVRYRGQRDERQGTTCEEKGGSR